MKRPARAVLAALLSCMFLVSLCSKPPPIVWLITAFARDSAGRIRGIVAKDLQEVLGDGIIAVKVQ